MLVNPKPGFWLVRWAIASDPFEAMGIWIDAYEATKGHETELSTQQEIYLDFWKAPLPFRIFDWCKDQIAIASLNLHNCFYGNPWEKRTIIGGQFRAEVFASRIEIYRDLKNGDRTLINSWYANTQKEAVQEAQQEIDFLVKEVGGNGENF